jgi:diaminohydroxyphosphoribosylaminopyrimidine deaminase / 5-amino-6-(5-phosphoribosylamino)uracil reductase
MTQQPGAGPAGQEQPGPGQSPAGQSPAGQSGAAGPGEAQPQADLRWLREAIELSRRCPPSDSAFCVGAVLVSGAGDVIATGYSRELDPKDHAEEVVLAKAAGDPLVSGATLYSSLEPCLARASRPRSCAELIVSAGIPRVVIAWLEPPLFARGGGAAELRQAGLTVDEIPWLAEMARSINAHLL